MAHRNRWFTELNSMVIFHGELLVITRWYIPFFLLVSQIWIFVVLMRVFTKRISQQLEFEGNDEMSSTHDQPSGNLT